MIDADNRGAVFISYAWGAELENKEWVRQQIADPLDWNYQVFWDRDSIGFGESIDGRIASALAQRPILVLCLCDPDYIDAARRVDSGLHRELQVLTRIADEPGVRIVPLILGRCVERLPEPLVGRAYLDLQPLHNRGLGLETALLCVAEGLSQAQVRASINAQMAMANLRQRARAYLQLQSLVFWGNGNTHEVTVHPDGQLSYPLRAPQWMWDSEMWSFMLGDEVPTYCPIKGRWHWDRFSPSRGMQALGTAVLSAFFPQLVGEDEQRALSDGGVVLAQNFFSTVYVAEPFRFDMNDVVTFMINHPEGYRVLETLLDAVDS
ncbi:toll/interleukin-1 receptor domain-containing protein [Paralcaligenes ureilyticus]|uniref:TIR domain-containing protein n=1 Tax=Paralcaligenes ureilyticus TaxID=627131 RepID=A0A4R3M6D8_9BURK|nr:toll/interleukin-1 receptor domain-containing protein [Paralcaligenes ureilyticus]TCT08971.1 TIR domain-containing protein [Paralcaligenes ureilyticus]